jgi:hypothetical protein
MHVEEIYLCVKMMKNSMQIINPKLRRVVILRRKETIVFGGITCRVTIFL